MDYMLTKEWVGEEVIVEEVKVHHKLIRRALRYLEKVLHSCVITAESHSCWSCKVLFNSLLNAGATPHGGAPS